MQEVSLYYDYGMMLCINKQRSWILGGLQLTLRSDLACFVPPCLAYIHNYNSNCNIRDNVFTLLVVGVAYTSTTVVSTVMKHEAQE
jgi:hypothetical protein